MRNFIYSSQMNASSILLERFNTQNLKILKKNWSKELEKSMDFRWGLKHLLLVEWFIKELEVNFSAIQTDCECSLDFTLRARCSLAGDENKNGCRRRCSRSVAFRSGLVSVASTHTHTLWQSRTCCTIAGTLYGFLGTQTHADDLVCNRAFTVTVTTQVFVVVVVDVPFHQWLGHRMEEREDDDVLAVDDTRIRAHFRQSQCFSLDPCPHCGRRGLVAFTLCSVHFTLQWKGRTRPRSTLFPLALASVVQNFSEKKWILALETKRKNIVPLLKSRDPHQISRDPLEKLLLNEFLDWPLWSRQKFVFSHCSLWLRNGKFQKKLPFFTLKKKNLEEEGMKNCSRIGQARIFLKGRGERTRFLNLTLDSWMDSQGGGHHSCQQKESERKRERFMFLNLLKKTETFELYELNPKKIVLLSNWKRWENKAIKPNRVHLR